MDDFKPIVLEDKENFDRFLLEDPPVTSELTFTNLFMWRHRYNPVWRTWGGCLLIIMQNHNASPFGLPPVGLGDRVGALNFLVQCLRKLSSEARIGRVSEEFVEKHVDKDRYMVLEDRDNSDYVYLADDLANLPGNKFHKKKNHVNRFVKKYQFEYRKLDEELVELFLEMQEKWCELKNCVENPDILVEDRAVYEALTHHEYLGFAGGAILINSKVEAFALGEALNSDTAVIHVEKANPEIPGLYAVINQLFCKDAWLSFKYVNREQDLGVEGLRKAKESYHPHHMVKKFTLMPKH